MYQARITLHFELTYQARLFHHGYQPPPMLYHTFSLEELLSVAVVSLDESSESMPD